MRGIEGKQGDDDMGINRILEPRERISQDIIHPWKKNYGAWGWDDSSHLNGNLNKRENMLINLKN